MIDEAFYFNVYAIVEEIPKGYVTHYQCIAQLTGRANASRMVGRALRYASFYGDFPCHRVLHKDGSLVVGWEEQRQLLEAEGVPFRPNGKVDMKQCLWTG